MNAADNRLVRRDVGLVQLLDPPFDKTNLDPGYIRGYVPGVRENGGQYTHAAIWMAMAFASLGDHRRAWELARMANPIERASTVEGVATYKVEPYVVAADVYAVAPHAGAAGGAGTRARRVDVPAHPSNRCSGSRARRAAAIHAAPSGGLDRLHDALPLTTRRNTRSRCAGARACGDGRCA
jgi:hypothetical protein